MSFIIRSPQQAQTIQASSTWLQLQPSRTPSVLTCSNQPPKIEVFAMFRDLVDFSIYWPLIITMTNKPHAIILFFYM